MRLICEWHPAGLEKVPEYGAELLRCCDYGQVSPAMKGVKARVGDVFCQFSSLDGGLGSDHGEPLKIKDVCLK